MRILMWVSFYWPEIGGVETFTRQLAHALKRRGHTVCIITAHGRLRCPDVSDDDGIAVHRFPFWEAIEKRDPVLMLETHKRLTALKTAFKADIIHGNSLDVGTLFQVRSRHIAPVPSVITLHWTPPAEYWIEDGVVGTLLRSATWIAAISSHQMALIQQTLPERHTRASLFLNGLDAPQLPPTPIADGCQRILCIGRLVKDKGFDLALTAFARIHKEFPNARLVVGGDGVERPTLEQLAGTLGIADQTDFIGWVSHDDVPALMNQSLMVVMPSRCEPFGLVALETGHMERPIVATRVGGLADIVADGETGFLVPEGDVDALAAAMAHLMQRPAEAVRMGRAGRKRAIAHFSGEHNTDLYEALFQRLTQERTDAIAG